MIIIRPRKTAVVFWNIAMSALKHLVGPPTHRISKGAGRKKEVMLILLDQTVQASDPVASIFIVTRIKLDM